MGSRVRERTLHDIDLRRRAFELIPQVPSEAESALAVLGYMRHLVAAHLAACEAVGPTPPDVALTIKRLAFDLIVAMPPDPDDALYVIDFARILVQSHLMTDKVVTITRPGPLREGFMASRIPALRGQ